MSIQVFPELTDTQNTALRSYEASLKASLNYTQQVQFATPSAKIRFASRLSPAINFSAIVDSKIAEAVAGLAINCHVNSNRIIANASVKAAFNAMKWSSNSKLFANAQASLGASIDANASLSAQGKIDLKAAFEASLSGVFDSIGLNSILNTKAWAAAKLNLLFKVNTDGLLDLSGHLSSSLFTSIQSEFGSIRASATAALNANFLDIPNQIPANTCSPSISDIVSQGGSIVVNPATSGGSGIAVSPILGSSDVQIDNNFATQLNTVDVSPTNFSNVDSTMTTLGLPDTQKSAIGANAVSSFMDSAGIGSSVTPSVTSSGNTDFGVAINQLPPLNTQQISTTPFNPKASVQAETPGFNPVYKSPTPPVPAAVIADNQYTASLQLPSGTTNFQNGTWVLEWRPSVQVGIIKVPYEKILTPIQQSNGVVNVLALNTADTDSFGIDTTFSSIILPISAENLIVLQDMSITRRTIQNLQVTQGTKYYQTYTEHFPEFVMTLQVAKFGKVSERVIKFFDIMISYITNQRKYPGSLYLYDVFKEQPDIFSTDLVRYQNHRKYKLLPRTLNKSLSSSDNMMVKLTVSGNIVEWNNDGHT